MVIMITGLPGTGKSHLARALAHKLGARYISTDQIRKEMLASPSYTPAEKKSVYETLLRRMNQALEEKQAVVLDGTFYEEALRTRFAAAMKGKSQFLLVELTAPEEMLRERLQTKRPDSDADFEVYQQIRAQWEPIQQPHLVLNTGLYPLEELLNLTESYIQSRHEQG